MTCNDTNTSRIGTDSIRVVGVSTEQEYEVMVNENEMSDEQVEAKIAELLPNFVGNADASVITLAVCFMAFNRFLEKNGLQAEFVEGLDEDECLALILGTQIVAHPELYGDDE